jgi:hypothetical protein
MLPACRGGVNTEPILNKLAACCTKTCPNLVCQQYRNMGKIPHPLEKAEASFSTPDLLLVLSAYYASPTSSLSFSL